MIKELIVDLAYDKITLSQGLTRAKLIAKQIQNNIFKSWLTKELNGYKYDDKELPDYRKVWAEIELLAEFSFGQTRTFPVIVDNDYDADIKDMLNKHRILEPISVVEQNLLDMEKSSAFVRLPSGMVQTVAKLYNGQIENQGGFIRSGRRKIAKSQLQHIIALTKQKLIDTLQDLQNEFPQVDQNYVNTEDNNRKVSNIITNNIYGNNNPFNAAAGENVNQSDISFSIGVEFKTELKKIGVDDEDIELLQRIDKENPKGSETRKTKILSWIGKVSASLAAKGIADQIPHLTEFAGNLI